MMLHYLGLSIVLIAWVAGYALVTIWKGDHTMSLSQHAAASKRAQLFFAPVIILGAAGLYYWFLRSVKPELQLPDYFTAIVSIIFVCQLALALVVDTVGWRRIVHRAGAYGMGFMLYPMAVTVLFAGNASRLSQIIGVVLLVPMTYLTVQFLRQKIDHIYLRSQIIFIVSFQLLVLSAVYLR